MFTIIITLLLPLVSLGIWRQYVLKIMEAPERR